MRRVFLMSTALLAVSTAAGAQTNNEWPASAAAPSAQPAAAVPVYRARDGEIIDSTGGGAIPDLPLTVYSNGTMKYVTGGVGDEEIAQLKSLEPDFNVQLLIASTDGAFMGNATVKVVDTKDTVLFTVDHAGPYFYLYLPPADYMIEVTSAKGNLKSIRVKAPASGATKPIVRF